MLRALREILTALLLLLTLAVPARAQEVPLPRVFVETTGDVATVAEVVKTLGPARSIRIGARIAIPRLEDAGSYAEQLGTLTASRVPVWVALEAPSAIDEMPAWRAAIQALFRSRGEALSIVEVVFAEQEESLRRFTLQVAATEARVAKRSVHVAISGRDRAAVDRLARGVSRELAPYVDFVVRTAAVDDDIVRRWSDALPGVRILRRGEEVRTVTDARHAMVRDALNTVGTQTAATAWTGPAPALSEGIRALSPAADLLTHEITLIDHAAAELALTQSGRDVPEGVTSRLLFDEETFATYLVYDGAATPGPVSVALRLAVDGVPVLLDLVNGDRRALPDYRRDAATSRATASLPLTGRPMLVNFSEGAATQFVDRAAVAAERVLAVEEIVARHREYQARLDAVLQTYRAAALMEQHFRPSLTDTGYDVVTENQYFVDEDGVEWEELSFSVNGSKWGADRPPFPLLQPEKVLSLPLELRLDQDYRYALDGVERIGVADCYRVTFEPTREDAALYRGTVWIDRRTFARRQVRAVQTRTSAPIISNDETHTYDQVAEIGGFPLVLLTRLTARQIVLIAGRNLLLEKAATFSDFKINDSGFVEARQSARRGPRVMYRDTDRGVRYLVKEGENRVVSDRATASAKAMAMGVLVDPSFAFPLPIFGINYLDFEVRGRPDTQFALLFGGVLAAGNLQRPKLAGTNLDASLDFFGIAAPASDRLFVDGVERESEALLTWPLSTGVNFGWQYTAFQKAQLQYHLRYDPFVRDRTTADTFVVPSSTVTQGIGGAWEYKRGGYSLGVTGTYFARAAWDPWGPAEALVADPPRTYVKYAAHLSRDFFIDTFQKIHLNVSYFGGDRLDRFSRYQFGLFDDTRIHGVPASGVRFDELSMIRGSYSFNVFEQYRLDLFAEQAWGNDRTVDEAWQPLTGLGFAVNLRAPWNTILRADVGKSLLPDRYAEAGSMVFQIMLLKPLGGRVQ